MSMSPRPWQIPSFPDADLVPYSSLEGTVAADIAASLLQMALAGDGSTWPYYATEQTVDRALVHYWEDDWPIQIRLRRRGKVEILAPTHSALLMWLTAQPKDRVHFAKSITVSAQLTYTLADSLLQNDYWRDEQQLAGRYSAEDKSLLLQLVKQHHSYTFPFLAAWVPTDLQPLPANTEDAQAYTDLYNSLQRLLPEEAWENLSNHVESAIHGFIQSWSGLPNWMEHTVYLPGMRTPTPEETERAERQRKRWTTRHRLQETALEELFGEAGPKVLDELIFAEDFKLGEILLDRANPTVVQQFLALGLTTEDLKYVLRYQVLPIRSARGAPTGQAQDVPCQLCGGPIAEWIPSQRIITALRGHQVPVCGPCMDEVVPAIGLTITESRRNLAQSREEIARVIQELVLTTGVIPTADAAMYLASIDPAHLGAATVLYGQIPPTSMRNELFPAGWLEMLAVAGVLEFAHHGGIGGVQCTAKDGHPCRSLGEKLIDDWLSDHQIAHDIEPSYPFDAELNPNARLRADFLVGDGVYIEYFGLMNRPEYAQKAEVKRNLSARHGIKLIELFERDLTQVGLLSKLGWLVTPGSIR